MAAAEARDSFEIILPSEGAWLVRLCARLSGNADASEDLAQETLLEAWRHRWKLQDPSGRLSWLAAIAGNVCARWRHAQARHGARYYERQRGIEIDSPGESVPDQFDLEVELERHELVDLLSRAMKLLPADTRTVLIERYVRDATHAEIGERLNLSEGAVRVRMHRGKVALERVLTEHFTEDLVWISHADNSAGIRGFGVLLPLLRGGKPSTRPGLPRRSGHLCRSVSHASTSRGGWLTVPETAF